MRGGQVADEGQHHCHGVLGRADRAAVRGVQHKDAAPGGRLNVDVVDTDSGPGDDPQRTRVGQQFPVKTGAAANDNRIGVSDGRAQVAEREPLVDGDISVGPQTRQPFRGQPIGDENFHPRLGSRAAACTAVPFFAGYPSSDRTRRKALRAAMICSCCTYPICPMRKIAFSRGPWPPDSTTPCWIRSRRSISLPSIPCGTRTAVTVSETREGCAKSSSPSAAIPSRVVRARRRWCSMWASMLDARIMARETCRAKITETAGVKGV